MVRAAKIDRTTKETSVSVALVVDGTGSSSVRTTVPFFDHMLTLFAKHGIFDVTIDAKGDTDVDFHHLVEDVGIVLGQAFKESLGDLVGLERYGSSFVPMLEAMAHVTVDLSARPHLVFRFEPKVEKVGVFDVELVEEFFRAFSQASGACVHVDVPYGTNAHHTIEATFKAFGRAMRDATRVNPRVIGVPSTKGVL